MKCQLYKILIKTIYKLRLGYIPKVNNFLSLQILEIIKLIIMIQ